jgi:hypothetical protein
MEIDFIYLRVKLQAQFLAAGITMRSLAGRLADTQPPCYLKLLGIHPAKKDPSC